MIVLFSELAQYTRRNRFTNGTTEILMGGLAFRAFLQRNPPRKGTSDEQ